MLWTAFAVYGGEILCKNDFEKEQVGSIPKDILVVDGKFSVKEENGNRFLEVQGTPLDVHGVLFGEDKVDGVEVSARIRGTPTGKRYPSFGIGLNGISGYKLRVSPGRRTVAIVRGEEIKKEIPFKWISSEWTHLKLQAYNTGENRWVIEGKVWNANEKEPDWMIKYEDSEPPPSGKASIWGIPFSSTPIQFDDIIERTIN